MVSDLKQKDFDLSTYSEQENVRILESDEVRPYLEGLQKRLVQLSDVLSREGEDYISPYIETVDNTLSCLLLKHGLQGADKVDFSFTIDPTDSGFPTFKDFYMLQKDAVNAANVLETLPSREGIVEDIRDAILRKRSPLGGQTLLMRREFFEHLSDARIIEEYHKDTPKLVKEDNGQRFYTMEWGCVERGTNVPVFYRMHLTQDSSEKPLEKVSNPNLDLVIYNSQRGMLDLRTIVSTIDREFPALHPKVIDKIIIGPYYSELTANSSSMDESLVHSPDKSVLKFSKETVATVDRRRVVGNIGRFLERNLGDFGAYVADVIGLSSQFEVYGPIDDSDRRMITSFKAKQALGGRDEHGDHCKIYGVTKDGRVIG